MLQWNLKKALIHTSEGGSLSCRFFISVSSFSETTVDVLAQPEKWGSVPTIKRYSSRRLCNSVSLFLTCIWVSKGTLFLKEK